MRRRKLHGALFERMFTEYPSKNKMNFSADLNGEGDKGGDTGGIVPAEGQKRKVPRTWKQETEVA